MRVFSTLFFKKKNSLSPNKNTIYLCIAKQHYFCCKNTTCVFLNMSPLCKIFSHVEKQLTFHHFHEGINRGIIEEKSTTVLACFSSHRCCFLSIRVVHVDINHESNFLIQFLLYCLLYQKLKLFQCTLQLSQTCYKMRRKPHFLNLSPTEFNARSDHYPISKVTEWLRLEGSVGGHLTQSPCSRRTTEGQLPQTMSRWLWSSSKDGDSTASLSSLCQCLVKLTEKVFPGVLPDPSVFRLCPLPVLLQGTTDKSLAVSSLTHPQRFTDDPSVMYY